MSRSTMHHRDRIGLIAQRNRLARDKFGSDDPVESRGCDYLNKRTYQNKREARYFAAVSTKLLGKTHRAYRCDACGLWHLTTRFAG